MKKENCSKCREPLDQHPNPLWCLMGEAYYLKQENDSLKKSITSWKDAWYEMRDKLGKLWWHHPALYCDKALAYYRNNLKKVSK